MRAFFTPLLAALLVAAASPTMAQPKPAPAPAATGVTSDVRCLLTMFALGQDKQRQQAAIIGIYFFEGRINARAPGLNLPAAVKAEAAKMNGQSLSEEAKRCGVLVEGGVRTVQASLSGLRAAGPAPAPGAPALGAALPPTASGLPPAIPALPVPAPK